MYMVLVYMCEYVHMHANLTGISTTFDAFTCMRPKDLHYTLPSYHSAILLVKANPLRFLPDYKILITVGTNSHSKFQVINANKQNVSPVFFRMRTHFYVTNAHTQSNESRKSAAAMNMTKPTNECLICSTTTHTPIDMYIYIVYMHVCAGMHLISQQQAGSST